MADLLKAATELLVAESETYTATAEDTENLLEAAGVAMSHDELMDFNALISQHLAPKVEQGKRLIEDAVKVTATKLKAWAFLHLQQAQKLQRPTALFEKILNDPNAAATQLARTLLGGLAPSEARLSPAKVEKELDDVLDNITM